MSFLAEVIPPPGFFDDDLAELGFVMNASRLWAYQPQWQEQIFDVLGSIVREHGLTVRQRGILVAACASTLGDSYCSLAWGTKLARATNPDLAAAVLHGDDHALTPAEQALATWTRHVRETGWTDPQIFGITVFAALRIAFSTVNDALGAHPDANYRTLAPAAVLAAVTFGRALETDVEVA